MAASIRETDRHLAELRHDAWETQCYHQELNDRLYTLEAERQRLRLRLRRLPAGGAKGGGRGETTQAPASWMREDHARLRQELRAAYQRDEEEAKVLSYACEDLERQLRHAEESNAELRAEATAFSPLLANQ